jgi:hypothetical protein
VKLLTIWLGTQIWSKQVFDILEDMDTVMGDAPNKPLPFDGDDDSWQTDNEDGGDGDGEEIIQHFLGYCYGENDCRVHHSRQTISYQEQLEWEQKNWGDMQAQLVEAYMEFMSNMRGFNGLPVRFQHNNVWFTKDLTSADESLLISGTKMKRFVQKIDEYAAVVLMRSGYIPTSPLTPCTNFSIDLTEFYHLLSKYHQRLGLQLFCRELREYHDKIELSTSTCAFPRAYSMLAI